MGVLVDGVWKDQWHETESTGGRFGRSEIAPSQLDHARCSRSYGGRRLQVRARRYHLYVSFACSWRIAR